MSILRTFLLILSLAGINATAGDWPAWRGPNGNGIADDGQAPPLKWSEADKVTWKTPVPGRGHSSPILTGNRIFLTTADEDEKTQSVLAFDRAAGTLLWQTEIHRGGFPEKLHRKNTHATPTPACDGERVFAVFNNGGGITLTALDLDGNRIWNVRTGDFRSRYPYGYGASPLLYGPLVIVVSEFEKGGFLAAYDRETGKEIWRTSRAEVSSYSSPIVGKVAGQEQLLISSNKQVSAYDPLSGKPLWSAPGGPQVTAGTVVWEKDMVFVSGGFPDKETAAIQLRPGNEPEPLWKNGERCYEQSMLIHDGHVYAVNDGGIAICWRASDGKEMWKERLGGGAISASPILANGHIYATVERGITYVFRADPSRFRLVAENILGNETFATPAFVGGRIYLRVAENSGGKRQEWLYCLGSE